jgi:hypothetical protein
MNEQNTENSIEIQVEGNRVVFSWNDEVIQKMAEELGEAEFAESRPCG